MEIQDFEQVLDRLCEELNAELKGGATFTKSADFELRVREKLQELLGSSELAVDFAPHPHVFPDIVLPPFGVEVKFTLNDTWRSVANSIFESTRSDGVFHIFVVFGKMGGEPEVRWGRYGECVMHVRTSHVPRFEVEMLAAESLFTKIGVTYDEFARLPIEERMRYIRTYARGRLKAGERLWWLEDQEEPEHSLPIQARLYMTLEQAEKRKLRAEASLLCPQIVKPSRKKNKYDDAVLYLLTYHGVLCSQARDLFSAGSVAMRADATRGGNYIERGLLDIQGEMREAARTLSDELFVEYWGESVEPSKRIREWLRRADSAAETWTPSDSLFKEEQASFE